MVTSDKTILKYYKDLKRPAAFRFVIGMIQSYRVKSLKFVY